MYQQPPPQQQQMYQQPPQQQMYQQPPQQQMCQQPPQQQMYQQSPPQQQQQYRRYPKVDTLFMMKNPPPAGGWHQCDECKRIQGRKTATRLSNGLYYCTAVYCQNDVDINEDIMKQETMKVETIMNV